MQLIEAFALEKQPHIAFVGAGGKTTAIFRLAREMASRNQGCILVSATTHLSVDQTTWADKHLVIESPKDLDEIELDKGVILLTGPEGANSRTTGLNTVLVDSLGQLAKDRELPLLIEADGSRRKPLKAPAAHEPVIPPWVDEVVVVAGLKGVGKPLNEANVHRHEIFCRLSGIAAGLPISLEGVSSVLLHSEGGLKDIPKKARRTVLLNQCDNDRLAGMAKNLAPALLQAYRQVVLSQLETTGEEEVLAVYRRVAGVVLAAGGSERLGQPKQLLDWHGKTFVRAVAETALAVGLSPVLVVTGSEHERVVEELSCLPVRIVQNLDWEQGQSSSVRVGVGSLPRTPGDLAMAAVFLLVDQPQIPASLVQALVDMYAKTLAPIIAPMVDDRRGNPVLFDQTTFRALQNASGDAGGRQIFARFPVKYLPWLDAGAGLDVDTLEDYKRLLRAYPD